VGLQQQLLPDLVKMCHAVRAVQGISKQALQAEDMQHIVQTLEYDGLIDAVTGEDGETQYRQVCEGLLMIATHILPSFYTLPRLL
jgi:hypothetical protein